MESKILFNSTEILYFSLICSIENIQPNQSSVQLTYRKQYIMICPYLILKTKHIIALNNKSLTQIRSLWIKLERTLCRNSWKQNLKLKDVQEKYIPDLLYQIYTDMNIKLI